MQDVRYPDNCTPDALSTTKDLSWSGIAPRIVLLHGFTGRSADFCGLAAHLPNALHAVDLMGHGPNSIPPRGFSVLDQAEDIADVVKPTDILLGYSMGGRLSLDVICRSMCAPKALILLGSSPGLSGHCVRAERRQADERRAHRLEEHGVNDFLDYWRQTPLIKTQERASNALTDIIHRTRSEHRVDGLAHAVRTFSPGEMPDRWSALEALAIPTLLVAGAEDSKYLGLAHDMAQIIPKSTWVSVEKSGHAPHIENPAGLANHIQDFLEKLDTGRVLGSPS